MFNVDSNMKSEEEAVQFAGGRYEKLFSEFGSCYGGIEIIADGGPSLLIEDEVPAIVKNICFGAIPSLVGRKNFVYNYFSYYGYVRIDPEGDNFLVSGDGIPSIRYPDKKLISTLYDCGVRFISLLMNLSTNTDSDESRKQNLIELLEEARDGAKRLMTSNA